MKKMNRQCSISLLFAALIPYLLLVFDGTRVAVAMDTLFPGQSISGSEILVSKNGVFELGFFSPSPGGTKCYLGIQYKNLAGSRPAKFWLGNRTAITSILDATLRLVAGELRIEQLGSPSPLWTSESATKNGSASVVAVLLDNGNFVLEDQTKNSEVIWQSFDHPADALLPGANISSLTCTPLSLTYTPPYNCTLMIDPSRKMGFVMSINGHDNFGTFPDGMVTQEGDSSVQLNYPENPNDLQYMKLNMGQVNLLRWVTNETITGWEPLWSYPSSCKISAFCCGAFGVCTSGGTCACIDGFKPSDPNEWKLGHLISGCSTIIPTDCQDGISTDKFFLPDDNLQLPDNPQNTTQETSEDCEASCLSQCHCIAYSYHGSVCMLWYKELRNLTLGNTTLHNNIYMRVGSHGKRRPPHIQLVMLVAGPVVLALLVMLVLFWLYKYNTSSRQVKVEGFLSVYSYAQLKRVTRNFSDKLGEGGFGSVFKGTVAGPSLVAMKKLKGSGVHGEKQFRAEVQTLGMIQHTNLVQLVGFCAQGTRRLLVYEYMPNGSLDSHLFSQGTSVLSWCLRRRIAIGVAKGLAYLHEECRDCIIHCDIKPENILLDAEFCPKIADFGMAKLLGRDINATLTTLRGTMGYLAPEWVYGQAITHKADVYSFGIVLFELISGRRTTENMRFGNHRYFPLYAAAKVNEGDVLCLLDARLGEDANVKELDVTCRVACWCIQDDEIHRPSMGQVVRMLEGAVDTKLPPIPTSLQNIMDGDDSGMYSAEV